MGGCLCSFRRDWPTINNVLNIITIGYVLPFITNQINQSSSDSLRIQAPSKDLALVSCIQSLLSKKCNRKGGKCKISWDLLSPVSSPQASPKVEASDRPKQAQHLLTCRNGNSRVYQGLSDTRGIGVLDRLVRHYLHISFHHTQGSTYGFATIHRCSSSPPSLSPTGLHNDCKGSKTDGSDKRSQTSPIFGQPAYQGPVSGGNTNEHFDHGRPDTVLVVDNKSRNVNSNLLRCFSFVGY